MPKLSTPRDVERCIAFLQAQTLPVEFKCEPWKEPRKLTANAYLWAFIYAPLVARCGFSELEWHEYFCLKYFGAIPYTRIDGTEGEKPKRTTTKNEAGQRDVLKGKEFNDFLIYVESECAKRGVFIERGAL